MVVYLRKASGGSPRRACRLQAIWGSSLPFEPAAARCRRLEVLNSSLVIGGDMINGIFGDGDDLLLVGANHQIKALTIGGTTDTNDPMFFAGLFPKSVTISKLKVDLLTDARVLITQHRVIPAAIK